MSYRTMKARVIHESPDSKPKIERNATIRALHDEGMPRTEIARQFNLSQPRVHEIIHHNYRRI